MSRQRLLTTAARHRSVVDNSLKISLKTSDGRFSVGMFENCMDNVPLRALIVKVAVLGIQVGVLVPYTRVVDILHHQ